VPGGGKVPGAVTRPRGCPTENQVIAPATPEMQKWLFIPFISSIQAQFLFSSLEPFLNLWLSQD
jgi:hypothetical protein